MEEKKEEDAKIENRNSELSSEIYISQKKKSSAVFGYLQNQIYLNILNVT